MLKNRLIPCVLMKNGLCVQSKGFKRYQALGNPFTIVERLSDWASDELIYLDISRQGTYDLRRDDLNFNNHDSIFGIISEIAKKAFMPLTFGGGIRSLEDVQLRLSNGADKISINTMALEEPTFIDSCAKEFGSQCVVTSMDVKIVDGKKSIFAPGAKTPTREDALSWAKEVESRGSGEIFLNSIDRDGRGKGYDLDLIHEISEAVSIPVIACGGVGEWDHFSQGLEAGASAVAAANIFHYSENSVYKAKDYLYQNQLNVRCPKLGIDDHAGEREGKL